MPSYTLNELLEAMEPQSRRDKALIGRCVEGLGLYAAQIAAKDKFSSKIDELRDLVENLVGYWGLDFEEGSKPAKELLQAFDDKVDAAGTGGLITGDAYQTAPNVIYGLHRYGTDMVASAGRDAMSDIIKASDLMKDIAEHWGFEPGIVDDLTTHLESEVRELHQSTNLPGQPLAAPETISEGKPNEPAPRDGVIPVQVLTGTQPLVTVTFSECDRLRGIEKMPLYLANDFFERLDAMPSGERSADGTPYHKTDFRIDFIKDGSPEIYTGHYDVGDGDGTLIEHIRSLAEFQRLDEGFQENLTFKGEGFQAVENARLEFIARVLVPIFEKHCEVSQLEASAMSELMGIYEGAAGKPPVTDAPRIAYLESVVDYVGQCREALNATGLNNLPEAPAPYNAEVPEMNEAEANFAGWLAVTESSRYRWVEDEIYRLNGRGAMYYTGGEDGVYMRIDKEGKLDAGNYEGAIPHIGEAMFKSVVTKQYDDFSAAYKAAMEAGGKQFMVDMFSGPAHQPLVKTTGRNADGDKPSVLDEIRESRSAPKPPSTSKPEHDKTKKKNQPEY